MYTPYQYIAALSATDEKPRQMMLEGKLCTSLFVNASSVTSIPPTQYMWHSIIACERSMHRRDQCCIQFCDKGSQQRHTALSGKLPWSWAQLLDKPQYLLLGLLKAIFPHT
jgi:hypothetical protein